MYVAEDDTVVARCQFFDGQLFVGQCRVPGRWGAVVAACGGDLAAQPHAQIRMDPLKQPDVEAVMQDFAHQPVVPVFGDHAITVADQHALALMLHIQLTVYCFDADLFFQERPQPEIVITRQIHDMCTAFDQARQFVKDTEVLLEDSAPVFEPEIEQITHDVE